MESDVAHLVNAAVTGTGSVQVRAAARLMSLLENQPQRLPELFRSASTQPAVPKPPRLILGITGAPGSGKSTLTDALISEYRTRYPDRRVGVVAVDPSSPFTGGAVLGDRVRMMRHATDPNVFVRSMATRGHLGGLTLGVRGVLRVMELIAADLVILETVGVGQSEVEVARVADLTIVVFAPGQGDSIQMLKAGLMEIGDIFAVNKADRPGSAELQTQLMAVLRLAQRPEEEMAHHGQERGQGKESAFALLPPGTPGIPGTPSCFDPSIARPLGPSAPSVILVSAAEHTGVPALMDALEATADQRSETLLARRQRAMHEEIRQAILEEARGCVERTLGSNGTVEQQVQRVMAGEISVEQLAQELLHKATKQTPGTLV